MRPRLPVRRTMLAVDVEGFTRPERDDPSRADLRTALFRLLEAALERSGVGSDAWIPLDTGDGACVLLDCRVSEVILLEECIAELRTGLKDYNRGRRTEFMLRLRVILHSGHVVADDRGWSGQQLNIASRLLNAEPLREELRSVPDNLVLMVSEAIYDAVIRDGWRSLDPGNWHRIPIEVKDWRGFAWLYTPNHPGPYGRNTAPGGEGQRQQAESDPTSVDNQHDGVPQNYFEAIHVGHDLVFDQRRRTSRGATNGGDDTA
jgi:class 3 adenylate cyclase